MKRDAGSARRRRERQLRSWLRHERMTVRMELAAALHHSAFKGAGPETNDALRSQRTVNSREEAVFFELYDEDTAGKRPPVWVSRLGHRNLFHSAPRSPCSRRSCPSRLLMFLCCRWLTSRWISCRFLTSRCPSMLLTCPKISLDSVPQRTMLPEPLLVEQLVEVPVPVPSFDDWVRWEETFRATGFTWLGGF